VARELAGPGDDGEDLPAADRITVERLTPEAVVQALAALQRAGLSPATRARIHGTLAGLCAYLVHPRRAARRPNRGRWRGPAETPAILPRYIKRDTEIARVLIAAGTPDPTGRRPGPSVTSPSPRCSPAPGARASEVCGVRIRDLVLDVEDPYVRVTGKGGVMRDCPLPPEVAASVQAYLASRQHRTRSRARRDGPALLNNHGGPLTPGALDRLVRRWFARAGVLLPRGAAAHAFRHTVAMQLIGRGEAVNVVQALLGHASLSSTQIYIRAAGHHLREAAHALPVRGVLRGIRRDKATPG
jgi:integrase/recombinase XerD